MNISTITRTRQWHKCTNSNRTLQRSIINSTIPTKHRLCMLSNLVSYTTLHNSLVSQWHPDRHLVRCTTLHNSLVNQWCPVNNPSLASQWCPVNNPNLVSLVNSIIIRRLINRTIRTKFLLVYLLAKLIFLQISRLPLTILQISLRLLTILQISLLSLMTPTYERSSSYFSKSRVHNQIDRYLTEGFPSERKIA